MPKWFFKNHTRAGRICSEAGFMQFDGYVGSILWRYGHIENGSSLFAPFLFLGVYLIQHAFVGGVILQVGLHVFYMRRKIFPHLFYLLFPAGMLFHAFFRMFLEGF